jgi:transcriptional regulator with XRE-family HTH domain
MSQLGDRLRTLRLERGLTQQELAVKAGLAVGTVARLETKPQPNRPGGTSTLTLEKIARALDVPMSALFDSNGDDSDDADAVEPQSA